DMRKAERPQFKLGKLALDAVDLLQADYIWPVGFGEAAEEIESQHDRVDVQGGETEVHGLAKIEWSASKCKARTPRHPLCPSGLANPDAQKKKKPRRRGARGFSGSLWGEPVTGEGSPITAT